MTAHPPDMELGPAITATFEAPGKLGINWVFSQDPDSVRATIEDVEPGSQAAAKKELSPGQVLEAINSTSVRRTELKPAPSMTTVMSLLQKPDRPMKLTLREPLDDAVTTPRPVAPSAARRVAPQEYKAMVDDLMSSAGIDRGAASTALTERGWVLDPAMRAPAIDTPGEIRRPPKKAGGGGLACCSASPHKAAALSGPLGASPGGAPSVSFSEHAGHDATDLSRTAWGGLSRGRRVTKVFGAKYALGFRLGSDDPLDQLWLKVDADGDGNLSQEEVGEVLRMMGREDVEANLEAVMAELDADGSGDIDIGE